MLAALATKIAVLAAIGSLVGFSGHAFAALSPASHHPDAGAFGSSSIPAGSIDRDIESGTMRQVPCAAGAAPGARCYLAR
jgi:hypothetical protein